MNWRYICYRGRKKEEEENAEIGELLCQPTNANGMTNTKRSLEKKNNNPQKEKTGGKKERIKIIKLRSERVSSLTNNFNSIKIMQFKKEKNKFQQRGTPKIRLSLSFL